MANTYKKTKQIGEFFEAFGEEHQKYDWDSYARDFRSHPSFNDKRALLLDVYIRVFLAYHRMNAINAIAEKDERIGLHNSFISFSDYFIEKGYSGKFFVYRGGERRTGLLAAECDALVDVAGEPALINFFYKEFPKEEDERTDIFRDIFGDNFSYGIIATRDRIGKRAKNFQERGGIVVPIPIDKNELKEIVRDVCKKSRFKIKEDSGKYATRKD